MRLHRVRHPTERGTWARYGYEPLRDAYVVIVHADGARIVLAEPEGMPLTDLVLRSMMRSFVMYGFWSNRDWKEALALLHAEPDRRPPRKYLRVARVIRNLWKDERLGCPGGGGL